MTFVDLRLTMSHTFPDNLRILLESPAGTTVVLMANAGGGTDLAPGTLMRFTNNGNDGPIPDAGPIQTGVTNAHQPGGAYGGNIALGAPAPQPPYATSFDAFDGQPARGGWRLWVYDDAAGNVGELESATLILQTDQPVRIHVRRARRESARLGSAVRAHRSDDDRPRRAIRDRLAQQRQRRVLRRRPLHRSGQARTSSMPTCR